MNLYQVTQRFMNLKFKNFVCQFMKYSWTFQEVQEVLCQGNSEENVRNYVPGPFEDKFWFWILYILWIIYNSVKISLVSQMVSLNCQMTLSFLKVKHMPQWWELREIIPTSGRNYLNVYVSRNRVNKNKSQKQNNFECQFGISFA